MADLTNEALKGGAGMHDQSGYIPPADQIEIAFSEGSKIEGRKPGTIYTVNSGLAHHYCEVLKVATKVEKAKPAPKGDPGGPNDRSMEKPPRAPKG